MIKPLFFHNYENYCLRGDAMKIVLIPNSNDKSEEIAYKFIKVFTASGDKVVMPLQFGEKFSSDAEILEQEACFTDADICIVLGGDGAVLHAGKTAALHSVPVLAVNTGRVGFLAALEGCDAECIYEKLGSVRSEKRTMLEVKVLDADGKVCFSDFALNEAVISRGEISRIIEIALSVNGKEINSVRGDGLVISTPTGSTAYSMSAGGPIVSPEVSAITVTPICPYTLASRAMVLSDSAEISAYVFGLGERTAMLTVDGDAPYSLQEGMRVSVRRAEITMELLMSDEASFYGKIKTKLFGM